MTEGIIKEVFKKHVAPYPYPFGTMLTVNVMAIEQELIEKIKKEFPTDNIYTKDFNNSIRLRLIGAEQ